MAGIISPSMPLFVVENKARGNRAYSNFNEGLGKVLRFGANGPEVIDRLRTMAAVSRRRCVPRWRAAAPIELKPLMAQALNMGDEVHNRNAAATALFFKRLAPALFERRRAARRRRGGARVHRRQRPLLPQPVDGRVQGDVRRRGRRRGQLDGDGDGAQRRQLRRAPCGHRRRWFEAPANPVDGLYFPGYSIADAAADLGDSAITETAGVGGFAMAAAPAIVKFVGGTSTDAIHHSLRMRAITLGANPVVHAAGARLRGGRRRHRRAQGGRLRRAAGDQQRHRAPGGRRRADRRRRHHRADGVLHGGGEGARARRAA